MRKLVLLAALLAAAYFGVINRGLAPPGTEEISRTTVTGDEVLARVFEERRSSVQVQGAGVVKKILPDDNDGSRHQRFIMELASGQTLLIAHNIDQAPRIRSLKPGDRLEFSGEYEWNPQGGVIHWTHRDPGGSHLAGWIRHNGQMYW